MEYCPRSGNASETKERTSLPLQSLHCDVNNNKQKHQKESSRELSGLSMPILQRFPQFHAYQPWVLSFLKAAPGALLNRLPLSGWLQSPLCQSTWKISAQKRFKQKIDVSMEVFIYSSLQTSPMAQANGTSCDYTSASGEPIGG